MPVPSKASGTLENGEKRSAVGENAPHIRASQDFSDVDEFVARQKAVAHKDASKQTSSPRPTEYNSLPTGTRIEEDVGTSGHGELTVDNGTAEDAVVRLSDVTTGQTVRWFFVQAHSSAHVSQVPQGSYRLRYITGLDWTESKDSFSWRPSYNEFGRTLDYIEQWDSDRVRYHAISVTLHPVVSGNVRARAITREEFLRGHRHVALQR